MGKKANLDEMHELHKLVAEYYAEQLSSGEELSSGTLAAVNAFLKNNDIKVDVVESEPLQNLQYKIQDLLSKEA